MGVPGMILAPVMLHYIKVETKRARISRKDGQEQIVQRDEATDSPAPEPAETARS